MKMLDGLYSIDKIETYRHELKIDDFVINKAGELVTYSFLNIFIIKPIPINILIQLQNLLTLNLLNLLFMIKKEFM